MENLNKQPKETQERAHAFDPVHHAVARNKINETKARKAERTGRLTSALEKKHPVTTEQQNEAAANASGYKKKSWM